MLKAFKSLIVAVLLAAGTQGASAQLYSPVTFSAQLNPFTVGGSTWSGGLLSGSLEVSDNPYQVLTNPSTGEIVARYAFTGQMLFDGVPITLLTSREQFLVVFDHDDPTRADTLGFRLYFEPFQVAPNLALVAMDMDFQLPEQGDPNSFSQLAGISSVLSGGSYLNLLSLPDEQVIYGVGGGSVSLAVAAPIPEPSTYALMLAGLGAVVVMSKRRRVPALHRCRGRRTALDAR